MLEMKQKIKEEWQALKTNKMISSLNFLLWLVLVGLYFLSSLSKYIVTYAQAKTENQMKTTIIESWQND